MTVSPSCIRQIYALSSSPPETAMELFIGSIDTEKIEAEDKDSDWTVLINEKYKKQNIYSLKIYIVNQSHAWGEMLPLFSLLRDLWNPNAQDCNDHHQSYGGILNGKLVYRKGFTPPEAFHQQQKYCKLGLSKKYTVM